jgi:hypothetical protein
MFFGVHRTFRNGENHSKNSLRLTAYPALVANYKEGMETCAVFFSREKKL